jgi:hypothetical protein
VCVACESLDTPGCRACHPGNEIITDTSGAAPTDLCSSCVFDKTYDNDANSSTPCVAVSSCTNTQGENSSPTLLRDRTCKACSTGKSFINDADYSKRTCVKVCKADEYESQIPTETSDRVCLPTVQFVIDGDFATLIGSSVSAKANELRTKVRNAFVSNGIPDDSFVDISLLKGSIIVKIATPTEELANRMRELVRLGKISVTLDGRKLDASTSDTSGTASSGVQPWVIGAIVGGALCLVLIVLVIALAKRRTAKTTMEPSFMYSTQEGTLEASGFSNPLYDGQKVKMAVNPIYKEDGYLDVKPGAKGEGGYDDVRPYDNATGGYSDVRPYDNASSGYSRPVESVSFADRTQSIANHKLTNSQTPALLHIGGPGVHGGADV